jgi:hypothetical protein
MTTRKQVYFSREMNAATLYVLESIIYIEKNPEEFLQKNISYSILHDF